MDEFSFIHSIQPKYYRQSSTLKGIGDDGAVFRPPADMDIVTATDTMVQNIHFRLDTMEPEHIGYRALAANLSDLAAMGSIPISYFVSIVAPESWTHKKLKSIYKGMNQLASEYSMDLLGGDTVSGDQLVLSITVIGFVERERARYRHHAKEGDIVFVTGTLGDSALGYDLLTGDKYSIEDQDYFIQRHRMPQPRVSFSRQLKELDRLCFNDISDGISSEANEIAEASQVDVHIDYESLPVHPKMKTLPKKKQAKLVLSGGEDFELIGTVSEKDWPAVLMASKITNTNVAKIGYVRNKESKKPKVCLHEKGKIRVLKKEGYNHLR
ncbi:MAG: thiamine-phosphate kinase [Bacillaceae bacterium]|nr:thiamine-phosphate kinase [Bacillaceae bacterium]